MRWLGGGRFASCGPVRGDRPASRLCMHSRTPSGLYVAVHRCRKACTLGPRRGRQALFGAGRGHHTHALGPRTGAHSPSAAARRGPSPRCLRHGAAVGCRTQQQAAGRSRGRPNSPSSLVLFQGARHSACVPRALLVVPTPTPPRRARVRSRACALAGRPPFAASGWRALAPPARVRSGATGAGAAAIGCGTAPV